MVESSSFRVASIKVNTARTDREKVAIDVVKANGLFGDSFSR